MFDIVLCEPEIPPNTGNIMRLCTNVGARLHLIEPLGFRLTERQLRRAGLDYADKQRTTVHRDWAQCRGLLADRRWFAVSTRGRTRHDVPAYRPDDVFVFGPETRGLPPAVIDELDNEGGLRIPMVSGNRSLNLSNAVAVVIYEAWRQNRFAGAA
jgi:tRNA (cytidine/uridine-2'-O-)-methyltransferase